MPSLVSPAWQIGGLEPLQIIEPNIPKIMKISDAESLIQFYADAISKIGSHTRAMVHELLDRMRNGTVAETEATMVNALQAETQTEKMLGDNQYAKRAPDAVRTHCGLTVQ